MSLIDQVTEDLKEAMDDDDKPRISGLRAIKTALTLAETESNNNELSEAEELHILQRLVKKRQEALNVYEKQNRIDQAETRKEELEVIEEYLPEPLTKKEIKSKIQTIIDDIGAQSMKDMGRVMKYAKKEMAGRADERTITQYVEMLLR